MSKEVELIKEIAAKHGIAVGRDDPIMILQTINARLMQDSQKAQQEMLDTFKSELEEMSHRWGIDAKGKAERILNASLAASKDAMRGVAIFAIDFSGRPARKISKNHATANAFGCPDSSCFARFDPTRGRNIATQ